MKTIAITGGAGFIGERLARALLGLRGVPLRIRLLDLSPPCGGDPALFVRTTGSAMDYVPCDLTKPKEFARAAEGADVIVHLARSEDAGTSGDLVDYNCSMAASIGRHISSSGVQGLLFASTFQVYGSRAVRAIDENAPCAPATPYAQSKHICESMFRDIAGASGIETMTLRYFSVYGAGAGTGILKAVHDGICDGKQDFTLRNDGEDGRDFIHVNDAVRATTDAILLLKALRGHAAEAERDRVPYAVINIGTGRCTTIRELMELSAKAAGKALRFHYGTGRDAIRSISADTGRMSLVLGTTPRIELEDGLSLYFSGLDHL